VYQKDSSLNALYRIYENVVLNNYTTNMRNEFELFFNRPDWPVSEMPYRKDRDPARYVVLACVTQLLVMAFSNKNNFGIPRGTPGINSKDQIEEIKKRPHVYESAPGWTEKVPPIDDVLKISYENGEVIVDFEDNGSSALFKEKYILLCMYIYFL
jgi:hypothetical protein